MAPKKGLVPVQNQMYGAMAEAMLNGMVPPPISERNAARRLEEGILPKLRGNEFYAESRWFYNAPQEPEAAVCTACVSCSSLHPAKCAFKCYSCAKFDPLRKGHFCAACFEARHPPYRQAHTFLPISEVEDMEDAAKAQRVRAEMDHRIAGIEELLKTVGNTKGILIDQTTDPLSNELVAAGRMAVDIADTDVHRLRRKLRDDIEIRDLVAKGELPFDTMSTRGWNKDHNPNRPRKLNVEAFEELLAANVVGRAYRMRQARRFACRRVGQIYTKSWYDDEERWFFVNTKTNTSSWEPPKVLHGDISYINTPRSFERKRRNGEHELDRIYKPIPTLGEEPAALLVQCSWRRKKARLVALDKASRIFQRVLDPEKNRYYYFNTITGVTSWKRPQIFASKAEAEANIQTPRAFAMRENAERTIALVVTHDEDDDESTQNKADNPYESTPFTINHNSSSYIMHNGEEDETEFSPHNNQSIYEFDDDVEVGGESVDEELPPGWESLLDEHTGQIYYYSTETGETSWDHPG